MYRVNLSYTVITGGGNHHIMPEATWLSMADHPDLAEDDAKASIQVAVHGRFGPYAKLIFHAADTTEMEYCPSCQGKGLIANMDGFNYCHSCLGKKVVEVHREKASI